MNELKVGDHIAFEYGFRAMYGLIIGAKDDRFLIKCFVGTLIYSIKELEQHKYIVLPTKKSFIQKVKEWMSMNSKNVSQ